MKPMLKRTLCLLAGFCSTVATAGTYDQKTPIQVSGQLTQGGYAIVTASPGSRISYAKRTLIVDESGARPIGFSRDAATRQEISVRLPDGRTIIREITLAPRKYAIQRINGLKKRYVSPDKATLKKIREDIARARAARRLDLPFAGWRDRFIWPTSGIISGVYGSQRILNGKPRRPHYGVDIAAPTGTPVYAPAGGKVTLATPMVLSGNTLMIDHGRGVRSTFMHLSNMTVHEGELVKKGQKVGEVGATGRATGPHLHWGMSWFNTRLDPATFMDVPDLKPGARVKAKTRAVSEK
ncbi:Murein DD-endopeptidase MepM and murein hydrolase activator NlpD, contain LysM domain [Sulfurivirga caldicuralii]|uniref:Murein DD-endopeptidase MepM and murein hydrolase activator NlpD, contain LysM domain n=1 Tax=Sulfurivirga caldicuralii TaxID=364032 RepID=A0A1N6F593_9GAMM|nr:M23 family metallopeptidase [Sulfurivirga caldicuralii]SIN90431.1 Murein DD-endopeptidase MepM and murein hydrolase activator NlpD, contain LysM domain [Sulfurivirga caldicuralii]